MDGLPVRIVENYQSKNGVSVSRKSSGQKIANGHLSFTDSGQITPKVHLENRDNSDALITAKICERDNLIAKAHIKVTADQKLSAVTFMYYTDTK